jgi:hypothetical protein
MVVSFLAIGAFQFGDGFSNVIAVNNGMTIGWELYAALLSAYYGVLFYKYGNLIIKLLEEMVDQSPEVKIAVDRVNLIPLHLN